MPKSVAPAEPLLLKDLEEKPPRYARQRTVPLRATPGYSIDLKAIELELCAA